MSDTIEPVYEIHIQMIYFVLLNYLITFLLTFSFMQLTPSSSHPDHHCENVIRKSAMSEYEYKVFFFGKMHSSVNANEFLSECG